MVGEEHVSMIPAPEGKRWAATVNGRPFEVLAPSNAVLLDVLRDKEGYRIEREEPLALLLLLEATSVTITVTPTR